MFECKICSFVGQKAGQHPRSKHRLTTEMYYLKYVLQATNPPICRIEGCTKPCNFQGMERGYTKVCSPECKSIDSSKRFSILNNDPNSNVGFKNHWNSGTFLTEEESERRSKLAAYMNDNNPKFGYVNHSDELKDKRITNLKRKHREDFDFQTKIIDNISGWEVHNSPKAGSLHVRSTYEKKACELFDSNSDVVTYSHENVRIPYIGLDDQEHTYIIDFEVLWSNGLVELIEIKPSYQVNYDINVLKFQAAKLYAEEHNATFTIMTESELQLA